MGGTHQKRMRAGIYLPRGSLQRHYFSSCVQTHRFVPNRISCQAWVDGTRCKAVYVAATCHAAVCSVPSFVSAVVITYRPRLNGTYNLPTADEYLPDSCRAATTQLVPHGSIAACMVRT